MSQKEKIDRYELLIKQMEALIIGEENTIANLANISALLKHEFDFLWVGFYLTNQQHLILGPFQGPVACTRINFGKGVCGMAWKKCQSILVPDVDKFIGHIACSTLSKSELVSPIIINNKVVCILDADSNRLNGFDEIDKIMFEKICSKISLHISF